VSEPVRLAVLGDPLAYTLSPVLHRAGATALGFACESQALRTPPAALGERLAMLAGDGVRGVNLTHPLKADALKFVPDVTAAARRARSINTVDLGRDPWHGDTTDGDGFLDLLAELGLAPAEARTVLLGAGGSSRSLALALQGAGAAPVVVSSRDPGKRAGAWSDLDARSVAWRSDDETAALAEANLIVNCTPMSGRQGPVPLDPVAPSALIVDLVYGPALPDWIARARAGGRRAYDGLGLLVHQARRSLSLWFAADVPLAPLAASVGWPR
jgi:shikimate dehydrogenase